MHDTGTQTTRKVHSDIGIQCELILPPAITTSTPTKVGVGVSEPIISDISTSDDDDNDMYESSTTVDTTQSTLYEETSVSESELDVTTVEKQKTYVIFESALMLLFSICFMCRSTYIVINKVTIGSFLRITQICKRCKNKYVWESQPYVGKIPAGNIMISAAILHTGSLPTWLCEFLVV